MNNLAFPLQSLETGRWFKLICGASFQHLPAIRDLTLVYSLAGADCIDVAADPAVIAMTREAIAVATIIAQEYPECAPHWQGTPWLMMSLNDGEDPHFRKAVFDPHLCPADCPRPCEMVCPAIAIGESGVIAKRCYGCGRCLPVCPQNLIATQSYVSTPAVAAELITTAGVDAIEIHTQVGHLADFKRLWQAIAPVQDQLKLLAISCQDHPGVLDYLQELACEIQPLACPLLWQTDGRPMSGDIGRGTTHASIDFARKLLNAKMSGYVQLAGGTNAYTIVKLKELNLFKPDCHDLSHPSVAGIAFGSVARTLLQPLLEPSNGNRPQLLEHDLALLWQAVAQAHQLTHPLKTSFILSPTL